MFLRPSMLILLHVSIFNLQSYFKVWSYLYQVPYFYYTKTFFAGGKSGVFEIEDLVDLLKRENSKDVFVTTVPKEINYVEYICVVSARSKRHIKALAEFVRKVYKKKCHKSDYIPRIEGKDSDEWIALDLGTLSKKTKKKLLSLEMCHAIEM